MVLGHPGKLGKLAMGEWDTHSSRSKSAVPWISGLARALGYATVDQQTVEGIFSALAAAERKRLGEALASEVCRAVTERLRGSLQVGAVLVNMPGDWLGCAGEMGLWRRKNPS
jgi:cobalt-precorrin-5B (C1)-methyltransferase